MLVQKPTLHIIGAGWAGLSAAVRACQSGFEVHLYESAPTLGGRAASHIKNHQPLDHGQHILIGAYESTLKLLTLLGGSHAQQFNRLGLAILDAQGQGFKLPLDRFGFKALRALLQNKRWRSIDKLGVLWTGFYWLLNPDTRALLKDIDRDDLSMGRDMSVKDFFAPIPDRIMDDLIEPLCLSALNTNIHEASARLLLRVLRDAFQDLPRSCELLIPKVPLGELLPGPARLWLERHGAHIHPSKRVRSLLEFKSEDIVVLCTSAREAARLCATVASEWAQCAQALEHERICTVYLRSQADSKSQVLPDLIALDAHEPGSAQFAIKNHHCSTEDNIQWAFVISAAPQLENEKFEDIIIRQAQHQLGLVNIEVLQCVCDKQATFKAKCGLKRPPQFVGQNIWAAGDYVMGPYPSTLEGAVRSGQQTIDLIEQELLRALPRHPASRTAELSSKSSSN